MFQKIERARLHERAPKAVSRWRAGLRFVCPKRAKFLMELLMNFSNALCRTNLLT